MSDSGEMQLGTAQKAALRAFGGWGTAVDPEASGARPADGVAPESPPEEPPSDPAPASSPNRSCSAPSASETRSGRGEEDRRLLGYFAGAIAAIAPARREIGALTVEQLLALGPSTLIASVASREPLTGDGGRNGGRNALGLILTSSRDAYEIALRCNVAAFVGGEFRLIAHATRNDRLFARDWRLLVERKQRAPKRRLLSRDVIGGIFDLRDDASGRWEIRRVLARIGVRLVGFVVHERKTKNKG